MSAAVQEFLAVYSEALNALEDQIVKMRKEGEILEAFIEKAISGEGRRES